MFGWNRVVRLFVMAAVTACVFSSAGKAFADEEHPVKYRLAAWKSMHFDTEAAAQKDAEFLTKTIGCEVQLGQHDGHFDVSYRCPKWKVLTLKSDDEAHEMQGWLKKRGFETEHTH
jgi:hypothetical protein